MKKDSANLDFLRAIAVLSVYVSHIFDIAGIKNLGVITTNALGQNGVLMFFVHTSLVLMLSMERLNLPPVALAKAFYVRRAFRIYPLSMLVVIAIPLFSIPSFSNRTYVWIGWPEFFNNLFLVQNLAYGSSILTPLWSLPFEVQMYLLLPPLFFLVRKFPKWWLPFLLWGATAAIAPVANRTWLLDRLSLIQYAPCFLGGIVAYVLLRRRSLSLPFWMWPLAIAFAFSFRSAGFRMGWIGCLFAGVAIPQFREMQAPWLRGLSAWIAKYSYGIYLSHAIVFWIAFFRLRGMPFWIQVAVCAVLSIAMPVAMFHWIEKPLIGVGARIAARIGSSAQEHKRNNGETVTQAAIAGPS